MAYWWGVTGQTVRQWLKTLGVSLSNAGTHKLRQRIGQLESVREGRRKAIARARDPDRRAKIAAARRGKPRPAHVIEALRQSNLGRKPSAEARRKMSESHRRRGTRPPKAGRPWSADEDSLFQDLSATEVAQRTGRSLVAVYMRRRELGLPDGRRRNQG